MRLAGSTPLSVCIALPESLLALGIEGVLRGHSSLDAKVVDDDWDALAAVSSGEVVITDYERGMLLAHAFRSCSSSPGVATRHILVLSGRDREQEIRQALEKGVRGYLSPACSAAELIEALLTLARGQRYLSKIVIDRMASSFGRELLTGREQEVLALLAHGECNKQIARRLDIAIGTVKTHVKSVMCKLGASSRTKAICIASERGLVEVQGTGAPHETAHFNALSVKH
ncbi:response regulator transcription factor [uncultured Ramlibacter sp.]|uniref:response regulator transcription factor n=1 Tax=uncultured Ramlibacter sp. TaxID=260755 RepID=UPI002608C398|nr:response regulator transcription factor [uncultured Ramlibacter sp.]